MNSERRRIVAQLLSSAPGKNEDAARAARLMWLLPIKPGQTVF